MIKFIVLFVASVELAGHKARGLMLRGSRQILQPPYFSNSESQLDAGKSYLQVNKNNGKSLFKTNLYLQQDEQEQEQSYLQGKLTEEEIKRWIERKFPNLNAENILKGLNRLTFEGPIDSHDHLIKLLETVNDRFDGMQAERHLVKLEQIGGGKMEFSADDAKDLSEKIHYIVVGHEESYRDLLQRIGEVKHTGEIISGLLRLYDGEYQQFQNMAKLVEKRLRGSTAEREQAQKYISEIINLGSGGGERNSKTRDLAKSISYLTRRRR